MPINRRLTRIEFDEIVKCRRSPAYFINRYCHLRSSNEGRMPFSLYPFQEIVLSHFLRFPFNIILKCRQMGLSWLVAAYSLWLSLFFEDKRTLMISIKDMTAKALLKKVKVLYRNLEEFLQFELVENNMSKMIFSTGGEIESVPSSEEAGRSDSLSLLIMDEAAFIQHILRIWQAAYPTLSTGGSAIVLSTPNGMGNFFAELWRKSIEGVSLFNPIRLNWWYRPDFDMQWFLTQKANLDSQQLAQEILGDFIASGNLVFDADALRSLQEHCSMIEPIEILHPEPDFKGEKCGLYILERPIPGEEYILSLDLARGTGGDFNGAHVCKRNSGIQVAEYRSALPLNVFNQRAYDLGILYNHALAAPENNNMGIATVLYFQEHNYPKIYEHSDPLDSGKGIQFGFPTNSQTRPLLIDELGTSLREGVSGIRGIRTANELLNFSWSKKAKPEALPGKFDDLVMSYAINRYVRKMGYITPPLPTVFM